MMASLEGYVDSVRIPTASDRIYKDECCYSFDTPMSEGGLYICMSKFLAFGRAHVENYFHRTGNGAFLHIKKVTKLQQPKDEGSEHAESPPKKKPTRLAIGVAGGFDVNEKSVSYEEIHSIVLLPGFTVIPLHNETLPEKIQSCVAAMLSIESATRVDQVTSWDIGERPVSRFAENLVQFDNGQKIPPSGWKCAVCGILSNLWLNLTDGSILCGRKYFDGSGGNGHALEHYSKTNYPLSVKLGTITSDGADVYSYAEDDMVQDPWLAKHLSHFGINITSMEKTEKTMTELEIDANMKLEWDVIQESGRHLQSLRGPGYTGIRNLGNSCYLNSVMQVIFSIPDFEKRYFQKIHDIYKSSNPFNAPSDFEVQMAKFSHGLLSGTYSLTSKVESGKEDVLDDEQSGICPFMFKSLIGRGHSEFSSSRQQDASEFLLYLLNSIDKNEVMDVVHKVKSGANPTDCLRFEIEERIQCLKSGKVRYNSRSEYMLALPIPLEAAVNKEEFEDYERKRKDAERDGLKLKPEEVVLPKVQISSCFQTFVKPEIIADFYSTALKEKSTASKTTFIKSFPDYLFVQMKKFTIGNDWIPKKIDVIIDVMEELNLAEYRSTGLQASEELLPESEEKEPEYPQISVEIVKQLSEMGFPYEACRKAAHYSNNGGIEPAMSWIMEHMNDADFASPLILKSQPSEKETFQASEDSIAAIMAMGFSRPQALKSLKETDNNLERAADWLFCHIGELDSMDIDDNKEEADVKPKHGDGGTRYKLVAFISHMGTSTLCGHYVCHILKEGRWVIYNDRKVAISEEPPKGMAYLYLYKRL